MKRILLPTDFSDNALNAIRYTLQLFKAERCTFYLLNTYTPAVYQAEYILHSPGQIGLGDVYQANTMEDLAGLENRLITEFDNSGHSFVKLSAFNVLIEEIVETVEKENIDLIAMGTQGATGAKEIVLGTNTVHVIRRAPCPVLAIPAHFEYRAPTSILFPTDYEVHFQALHVKELIGIAKAHHAKTHVLHVVAPDGLTPLQQKNKMRLQQLVDVVESESHEVPDQEIIPAINTFMVATKSDLLVMIQNEHHFLERLFIEPIIKKIAFHVEIPFMIIPFQD